MINFLQLQDIKSILKDPQTDDSLEITPFALSNKRLSRDFPKDDNGSPLLFPHEILPFCNKDGLDWSALISAGGALKQYFGIASIKWRGGEHNSAPETEHYNLYIQQFANLISDMEGRVLDIGCDNPKNTESCFPSQIEYVGIDPLYYIPKDYFNIHSISEFLPFINNSFNAICFGTSLDHAMDSYAALAESYRVLTPGGALYLSTLVWKSNAELYNDSVHFHHFREEHILEMLRRSGFKLERLYHMPWKSNSNREVLFLKAIKE